MRAARLGLAAGIVCCALVAALHQGGAVAAPAFNPLTRVVLFTPSTSDPLVARIEAELASVGIAVRRMPMPPDVELDSVVTREIAAGASAAIRIIPRSRGTEVWTGDTTARVLSRRSGRPDVSDAVLSVIALRTVEFLRASLLDVKRRGGGAGVASSTGASPGTSSPGSSFGAGTGKGAAEQGVGREGAAREGAAREGAARDRYAAAPERQPSRGVAVPPSPSASSGGSAALAPPARPSDSAGPVSVEVFPARPAEPIGARGNTDPLMPPPGDDLPWRETKQQRERVAQEREGGQTTGRPSGDAASQPAAPAEETRADNQAAPPLSPFANIRREPKERPARRAPGEGALEIAAGPAVLISPGGVGPVGGVAMLGRGPIIGRLGWELMAVFPLLPAHLSNAAGTVDVTTALFGAAARLALVRPGALLADLGMGFSGLMVSTVGTDHDSAWSACGHLRVGGGYRFNQWLAARADVLGGATGARTRISSLVTFSGNATAPRMTDLASWGPVFVTAILALQASW